MKGLLDIPGEVMRQHLFPVLRHNDLLRLRQVCTMAKDYVNAYLESPKKWHRGKWTLEIEAGSDDKNLQTILQMELPPPYRLHINLFPHWLQPPINIFADPSLPEFMRIYSKHVTYLRISQIGIPFTDANEVAFYESLVDLEELYCEEIKSEGDDDFKKKLETPGSCLIPSTFRKLKSFKFDFQSGATPTMTFVREMKCLEMIGVCTFNPNVRSSIPFLRSLIEDNAECKLKVIDWSKFDDNWNPKELLRFFALCFDKGIQIKGLKCNYDFLDVLLCNENGEIDDTEVMDEETDELVYQVNYQRNLFVGNVIYSMEGVDKTVFLMELPNLEELIIRSTLDQVSYRIWKRHGDPQWPNLRKMDISVLDNDDGTVNLINFLFERLERPKLEELILQYPDSHWWGDSELQLPLPDPLIMSKSIRNLKKLTLVDCAGDSTFFVKLWEGLPMLERVELDGCLKVGDDGFIGELSGMEAKPVFMKLEKLRNLSIGGIHDMPRLTDNVFREVFSHMKLETLKLSGRKRDRKPKLSISTVENTIEVTVDGIKALLAGTCAESMEIMDFEELHLGGLSDDGRSELKSCFRSSKLLEPWYLSRPQC